MSETMCHNTDQLSSWLYSSCQTVLNAVAPMKSRLPKAKSEPWLYETTRTIRRECRKAERKWKKDKLQVSFKILKNCWHRYQVTVKEAKRKHLSNIILSTCHKPCILFSTIDNVLSVTETLCIEPSFEVCEEFLNFFVDKVANVRAQIPPLPLTHQPLLHALLPFTSSTF